jgi:peptide/nickel transport system ATP-binding protein
MYAGEVVESGSATDVFARPQHPYTRGLIASIPIPGRTEPGGRLGSIPGTVPSLFGDIKGCAFRERCAHAATACAAAIPVHAAGGHAWRCVLEPGAVP